MCTGVSAVYVCVCVLVCHLCDFTRSGVSAGYVFLCVFWCANSVCRAWVIDRKKSGLKKQTARYAEGQYTKGK